MASTGRKYAKAVTEVSNASSFQKNLAEKHTVIVLTIYPSSKQDEPNAIQTNLAQQDLPGHLS